MNMSSVPFFEFTQDSLGSNYKTEPEWSIENEIENKEWEGLDDKYQIKEEEIEICDEKFNIVDCKQEWPIKNEVEDHDKVNGFNGERNLKNAKFENNPNPNDVTNIKNIKKFTVATENQAQCNQLKLDIRTVQKQKRIFPCPYCDYTAKIKSRLNQHILNMHEDKTGQVRQKLVCHICQKEFTSKSSLKGHINNLHLNIMKKCSECDYQDRRIGRLRCHILSVHHPENLYRCYNCEYSTPFKESLKLHVLRHHMRRENLMIFKCDHCSFTSNYKVNLRTHVRLMHINKKKKCPKCDHEAKNRDSLQCHIISVHHPEKLFGCHDCGYTTPRKRNLKGHILRLHMFRANEKTFKCGHCLFTSKYKVAVKVHITKMHLKIKKK